MKPIYKLEIMVNDGDGSCPSTLSQVFVNGNPYNPKFPRKETFANVLNCLPTGIGLTRRFSDRFKTSSDVISANYPRISLVSMFEERPNHSRFLKFPDDGGI